MPRPLLPANEGINLIMKNKTILITGGTTGIGLATAKLLSAEGAKIIVTGRNPETLAAVQRELPGVILIKSDSGSLSAAQSLGGEVKKHVNHLDGVFLNAGIDVTFNFSGGLLDIKGFPGHRRPSASADAATPQTVFQRLGDESDDRWIFTPNRVWIERRDGTVVEERSDPRAAFAGHVRETPWIACT
jgi:NAD(P)-dependent dehydrogenase (short-subunit alcohol dehydrogenase family)